MSLGKGLTPESVLDKIVLYTSPRRTRVREFFLEFDRLRCGRVSKTQFARAMNLVGMRLSVQDIDAIAQHYADLGQASADYKVNYEKFCETLQGLTDMHESNEGLLRQEKYGKTSLPVSHGFISKASQSATDWSQKRLSPMKKIQARVVERRLRLENQFQDFDALRKGVCTIGQVKTVFTILALDKELSPEDFKALQDDYSRADGMFNYVDFCGDVDLAFTKKGLERDPMTQLTMPDATATLPARRNRQAVSAEVAQKVFDLEDQIRHRVKVRRCHLRSGFQAMDRTRRGHVTRSQFGRVMGMLDFELSVPDIDALSMVYCDLGNLTDFNYADFCANCDPRQDGQPFEPIGAKELPSPTGAKYFDCFGKVHRCTTSNPTSPRVQVLTLA